jgi:hypothetical protein
MSSGRRTLLLLVSGITIWYVATLAFWAVRPLSDSVPVGIDYTLAQPRQVSVEVDCNNVFSGTARDSSPLPTLQVQPVTTPQVPALAFQRTPCRLVHDQARTVFYLDTFIVAVVLLGTAWLWGWRQRSATRASHMAPA